MIMFAKLLVGLSLTAATLFASPVISQASSLLLDQGDTTLDPATHLQWLDLTKTQHLGADDVLGNVGVSYIAEGWRYATAVEITRLWRDAGFAPGTYGDGASPVPPEITAFQRFLGVTEQHLGGISISAGIYAADSANPATEYGVATVVRSSSDSGEPLASALIDPAVLLDWETASGNRGSYLVHAVPVAATPLPAGLPMFAAIIALLGLAGWGRRSR